MRQGRGISLLSPDADGCKNAGVSGNGEVETECLHSRKRLFFISSTARGLFFEKRLNSTRAGRERGVSASVARDGCNMVTQRISPARSRVTDSSESRGGAVSRGEVCKTGEAPARGAARSAAGGRRRRPKAGDAFRGGATRPVPLTQNLRGENSSSPESFPAERVLPAPRAGERTLSAFLQWKNPLRPGSRNCP